MRTNRAWDEAELTDSETGRLRGHATTTELSAPQFVEVKGEELRWSDLEKKWVRPTPRLLEQFLDLTAGGGTIDPQKVVAFARRWGVLGICKHNLPSTHNPSRPGHAGCSPRGVARRTAQRPAAFRRWLAGELQGREPLAMWHDISRRARARMNIAARLHLGKRGELADWHVVLGGNETFESWSTHSVFTRWDTTEERVWGSRLAYERWELSEQISGQLVLGDVHASLAWTRGRPELLYEVPGLYGAIALQLALAVARTDALANCSHCGQSFAPTRKPIEGLRRFCAKCRADRIPVRYAMADRKRREKEQAEVTRDKKWRRRKKG